MRSFIHHARQLQLLLSCCLLLACSGKDLEAPGGPPRVNAVPTDWNAHQTSRRQAITHHLQQHRVAYDRFANFAVSETDGIPFIILKLLPLVAPDLWQGGDRFLSEAGMFRDERLPGYPAPRGIGFSGLARKDVQGNIDYASFTCGACHIGRVRLDDGGFQYLDGGINAEFNVIGFRERLVRTLHRLYGNETDPAKQALRIRNALLFALDTAQKQGQNYFYANYSFEGRQFDAAYEAAQIALFRQRVDEIMPKFLKTAEQVYAGWQMLVKDHYQGAEPDILQGYPGTEDAIGFNAAHAYFGLKEKPLTKLVAGLALPSHAGITDIMAVWNQDARNPRWNEDRSDLVDGGGQWNGHIPMPIYKNVAAQLTIGFDDIDVRVSAFSDELLDKLPAPAYPFDVDVKLAEKGRALFAENCAGCHQPNNGKVYRDMGTDMGRARISGTLITLGAQRGFTAVCGPKTTLDMGGPAAKDCAEYKGVSLEGKQMLAMTSPARHDGYNALPLIGIWAQAPYLHNGSVPTLYHLLVPSERPTRFVKSRLDYDGKMVGFSWDPGMPGKPGEGYLLDTSATGALSNAGHDKDVVMNGKTYRLDWSRDKDSVAALLEYLKTL